MGQQAAAGRGLSREMWVLQPPLHWTEHPRAGAGVGAAKCSVVGISLAGCVCIQCLFTGNASFHVTHSRVWVGFSACEAERGPGAAGVP